MLLETLQVFYKDHPRGILKGPEWNAHVGLFKKLIKKNYVDVTMHALSCTIVNK